MAARRGPARAPGWLIAAGCLIASAAAGVAFAQGDPIAANHVHGSIAIFTGLFITRRA